MEVHGQSPVSPAVEYRSSSSCNLGLTVLMTPRQQIAFQTSNLHADPYIVPIYPYISPYITPLKGPYYLGPWNLSLSEASALQDNSDKVRSPECAARPYLACPSFSPNGISPIRLQPSCPKKLVKSWGLFQVLGTAIRDPLMNASGARAPPENMACRLPMTVLCERTVLVPNLLCPCTDYNVKNSRSWSSRNCHMTKLLWQLQPT